jgi:hypothetical protein
MCEIASRYALATETERHQQARHSGVGRSRIAHMGLSASEGRLGQVVRGNVLSALLHTGLE